MKKTILFHSLIALILLVSCSKQNSEEKSVEVNYAADMATVSAEEIVLNDLSEKEIDYSSQNDNINTENTQTKKIIRRGNINIESKNNKATKAYIDKLIKETNAYYESESINSGSGYMNSNLIIRIPANQFDHFLQKLESGSDRITSKTISTEDVSIQYVDIESRLKSKRTYLARYQQLISSAKTTKDLLEIEEQIRQLQEDIESNTSILRSLSNQVNYSTLTIDIYYADSGNINQPNSFVDEVQKAIKDGWEGIKEVVISLISTWPVLIVISLLVIFGWRRIRKFRKQS